MSSIDELEIFDNSKPLMTILKDASDVFGPVGDYRGMRVQWEDFFVHKGIKADKDNRLNALFEVTAQVLYHYKDSPHILLTLDITQRKASKAH